MMNAQEADDRGGAKSEVEDNADAADCVYVDGQRLNVPRMIALIRNYPILYDKSHRHYHNEARKQQTWDSLASELQIDGEFLLSLLSERIFINCYFIAPQQKPP